MPQPTEIHSAFALADGRVLLAGERGVIYKLDVDSAAVHRLATPDVTAMIRQITEINGAILATTQSRNAGAAAGPQW